jgi:two-component system LytT family sensor kinase
MEEARHVRASAEGARIPWSRAWLASLAIGLLSGGRLFFSYRALGHPLTWFEALSTGVLDWGVWGALFPAFPWIASRFPLERPRALRRISAQAVASAVLSALHLLAFAGLSSTIRTALYGSAWRLDSIGFDFLWEFPSGVAVYWAVQCGIQLHASRERARSEELRTARMRAELATTRLRVLQMHLQPHFLFNTLNAVAAAIHSDPLTADRMLTRLGDLLQRVLKSAETPEVALEEELAFLRAYFEIETLRLGDKLRVDLAPDPGTARARVPTLLLQPLAENAVHHGIARRTEAGSVSLRSGRSGDRLWIEIEDDGPGLSADAPPPGVGLSNTRARLSELYGSNHGLQFSTGPHGGFLVRVELPWHLTSPASYPLT